MTLMSLMDTISEDSRAGLSGVGKDGGEIALALAVAWDLAEPNLEPRGTETGSSRLGVRSGGAELGFRLAVEAAAAPSVAEAAEDLVLLRGVNGAGMVRG